MLTIQRSASFLFSACALNLLLGVFGAFPKEFDFSMYNMSINSRYRELEQLLRSATWTAEKYMKREGFFNIMGGIWSLEEEVKYFYRLARLPGVNTICDIGFNAGHSAITFLHANPNATVISFDIGKQPWTMNSVRYVKYLFQKRFIFVKGDSGKMMTLARTNRTIMHGLKCDLVSVDGDHTKAFDDIWAGYFVSRPFAYVVVDDFATLMMKIVLDWNLAIRKKVITELDCHRDIAVGRGWCLGMYNNEEMA